MKQINKPQWLKKRGYLHFTPQIDVSEHESQSHLLSKISNKNYIASHAFFPLIHSVITERRYKKIDPTQKKRAHSHITEDNIVKKNFKSRPLHYATHIDAMIFGYYAELLLNQYEKQLSNYPLVSESIIAYRRIPADTKRNKSTINFAHEVFQEIKKRTDQKDCIVFKLDIKNFFSSINHQLLKNSWAKLLNVTTLPNDHYNVFKAATRFSYILYDDLRISHSHTKRKIGFDEKELAHIRKSGIQAFYKTPKEFRDKIKSKQLKIHRFPFRDQAGNPVGIPQGLPISAILANLYLFDFDFKIVETIVKKHNGYYRRYSDDIIIICNPEQSDDVQEFVNSSILDSKVEISKEKTEKFLFTKSTVNDTQSKIISIRINKNEKHIGIPFTYLGFEFYGDKTLIKSANLAKFYRRMIYAVKRKSKLAIRQAEKTPGSLPVIYRRQLYKLYISYPLSTKKIFTTKKWLRLNERGEYFYVTKPIPKNFRSNYITYVNRASQIMNEPAIKIQIRNHKKIFNEAIYKHLNKRLER
jgi:hypothetical protein